MFGLKALGRILIISVWWAVVWGLTGAAMGVVTTLMEPDTGHIPRSLVPIMFGLPSAAFGAVAGMPFACVLASANINTSLGPIGRVILGGVVGAGAGMIFMNHLAHSIVAVLLSAFLGATLAIRFARAETPAQN